ncbi:MAG: hypothetical protein LBB05_03930 [Puniceicoccales bacterium]|jgi:hypothetical protein|nr:hypothetical protein [Puniceicoccales bacterium]
MSAPIDRIDGLPNDDSRIDTIRNLMGLNDPVESTPKEFEASSSPSAGTDSAANTTTPEIQGAGPDLTHVPSKEDAEITNQKHSILKPIGERDSDGDGTIDELDATPNGDDIDPATQAFIDEMLTTDTDGDGILDFLDRTGSETQIEQMYDKDFERKLEERKHENVRAFMSLMSMFGNLDLTKNASTSTETGSNPIVEAAAGAAQISIMHSARIQELILTPIVTQKEQELHQTPASIKKNLELPQNPAFTNLAQKDLKKLIRQYRNQSNPNKQNNLKLLDYLVEAMPATNPMKAILQAARKSASTPTKS